MVDNSNYTEDELESVYKSYHHAEKTTDKPLIRVMALHALVYCERLFYLEEVEEIRVADANVYAGRRLHKNIAKGPEIYSLELASASLGLRGKTDCIKTESGSQIVYEHKKGKSKNGNEAWPSDRLQVIAYSMLLSEHVNSEITHARIKYHADNKLIKIDFDYQEARREIDSLIKRADELRACLERPPVRVSERLCRSCSLSPVCLPEEERFILKPEKKPARLFPADDERRIIHVTEPGSSIKKNGEEIVVYMPDGTAKKLPGKTVSSIVLHGNVQISTQTLHFCAANNIGVHWLSFGGFYVGAFSAGAGKIQRRHRQYQALQSTSLKNYLTATLLSAKTENQLKYLLRLTRGKDQTRSDSFNEGIERIRREVRALSGLSEQVCEKTNDDNEMIDILRGHEGRVAREYFALLPQVIDVNEGELLHFSGRNRRPPKDPFNSILSFGYALLYKDCVSALLGVGLEPAFGFMHTPRSAAYPLALDLMDLFRLILWDVPVIGSVNRKQWTTDDFTVTGKQVWLNTSGRRKAIALYEARKAEKWKHPVLNYSLSYSRTLELEARLLEKEWTGQPGLFAKMRLR